MKRVSILSLFTFICVIVMTFFIGQYVSPSYSLSTQYLEVSYEGGQRTYLVSDNSVDITDSVAFSESYLVQFDLTGQSGSPYIEQEIVVEQQLVNGIFEDVYVLYTLRKTFHVFSLLPAFITLLLCWVTREPIVSLFVGIVSGAMLLQQYQIINDVFLPVLMSQSAATIIVLYFILLGSLLGLWAKTGADIAFAHWMTRHFVKGPKSAKLVTWFLGILFFQGGTVSVVLVGTMARPLSDYHKVSHEELAYVVDSTASPIASQLAFNAWPAYVQSFIYVSGVSWLATETDRIQFFFMSVPFCFYAIFAVLGTFLLAIEKPLFLGKRLELAIKRSRENGLLDKPGLQVDAHSSIQRPSSVKGYSSSLVDFVCPLIVLVLVSIISFVISGRPDIVLAFSSAVLLLFFLALLKGMSLFDLVQGIIFGMRGLVKGLLLLLLAIGIGQMTVQLGAGVFMVQLLGDWLPYWLLPIFLQLLTILISFSTGTSWGTYAITFPIAMPLAWAISQSAGVDHPMFFMMLCFAAVMDGSVYGDQCSPISDTTVLSSMCTGCDLMEHVKTQIPQASVAALGAAICWLVLAMVFV